MHISEKNTFWKKKAPFMTKELHNRIMKILRFRNKFLKDKNQTNRVSCKTQRNITGIFEKHLSILDIKK